MSEDLWKDREVTLEGITKYLELLRELRGEPSLRARTEPAINAPRLEESIRSCIHSLEEARRQLNSAKAPSPLQTRLLNETIEHCRRLFIQAQMIIDSIAKPE